MSARRFKLPPLYLKRGRVTHAHYGDSVCTRCGAALTARVQLELDQRIGEFHDFRGVPAGQSQGWFHFGPACAERLRIRARAALAADIGRLYAPAAPGEGCMSAHDATLWEVDEDGMSAREGWIFGADGTLIAEPDLVGGQARANANAAHIVRCVNAHDGLVEALERCISELQDELPDDPEASAWTLAVAETVARARAALAKVAA